MRTLLGGHLLDGRARLVGLCLAVGVGGCSSPAKQEFVGPPEPEASRAPAVAEAPDAPKSAGEGAAAPAGKGSEQDSGPGEDFVGPPLPPSTLDGVHESVSQRVRDAATWVDSFLWDRRFVAETNQTTVTVRLDTFVEEREGVDFNLRFNMNVVLPQTQEKLHLVLAGYDDEQRSPDDDRRPAGAPGDEDRQLGLQYFLKATSANNIRGELGMRFNGFTPNPYVGARWRYTLPLGSWESRAFQRIRWYVEEQWEAVTTVDFERLLSENVFFRSSTSGAYYEEEPGYYYGQYFSAFHWISDTGLLTYEWNNYFRTRPEDVLDETQLRLRFSRRVFKDWILFEIAPQVTWRERIDYEPAFGLLFRFEFLFGGDQIQYHSPLHRSPSDPNYDERYEEGNR